MYDPPMVLMTLLAALVLAWLTDPPPSGPSW